MRTLVALAAALGIVTLSAAPAIGGVSVPADADRKVQSAVLRADEATGRAWVEVTLTKRFLSGKEARARGTAVAVAVPELTFDRATRQISVKSGEGLLTCATFDGGVQPTGACQIDAKIEQALVDTGFGLAKRDRLLVAVLPR